MMTDWMEERERHEHGVIPHDLELHPLGIVVIELLVEPVIE